MFMHLYNEKFEQYFIFIQKKIMDKIYIYNNYIIFFSNFFRYTILITKMYKNVRNVSTS